MGTLDNVKDLSVLLVGAGVIGSVYAGQLALGGCRVWVLKHGEREQELAHTGIQLQDVATNVKKRAPVSFAPTANERAYDLVLVAVQSEQLPSTFPVLRRLKGSPHIVFLGNNPAGHSLIPNDLPGDYELAFPGIAGGFEGDTVRYIHVSRQSTTLEVTDSPLSKTLQAILESRGFSIDRTVDMDGWLMYHALFIACILAALQAVDSGPTALGQNRPLLKLLCRAIEEGFAALQGQGVVGLPRALAILHLPILRPIAVYYWGNIMRSGRGELYFAEHARRAPQEAQALLQWTVAHVRLDGEKVNHLRELLEVHRKSRPKPG